MKKAKSKKRALLFQQKTLLVSLILFAVIVAGLVVGFLGCNHIATVRATEQLEDAANTVIDQISTKFERDGDILKAAAEIITNYGVILEDGSYNMPELKQTFKQINPIRQSMSLRILLADDKILLPHECVIRPDGRFEWQDGSISEPQGVLAKGSEFVFSEEKEHGVHISHRFSAVIFNEEEVLEEVPAVAQFVPIYAQPEQKGEIVAMLYGVTELNTLPSEMRLGNIYNGNASVTIFDVKNSKTELLDGAETTLHDVVMDTKKDDSLNYFEDLLFSKTRRGKKGDEIKGEILSVKDLPKDQNLSGYTQVFSEREGQWVCFYYASARNVVRNQWCICVTVPTDVAFGSVGQVRTIFILIGIVYLIAVVLYFIWIRRDAKRSLKQTVERVVLEERLHKAEAAERAKTTFLSNMSHDIRTPMNAILGFTTLAETNIDNKERVQDYLKKILSSGNHLLSLINDILDMSRIESGKLNIEEKPCSISDIFRDMRNIIQTQMKSKQLNFFMDTLDVVDEDIFCDKLHVNQILLNLLSNAIKFTPAGGSVSMLIRQRPSAPTGYGDYEIRVKDTGIGMSEEFAKHIFEPFERERNSTVSGIQGTGLGMAITKNIVDTMGGTIEVVTEPGKGTEFILNLQFRLQTEKKKVEVISELEGMRALVVDDSFSTCDSVAKMLKQIGMRSEWTMHGAEAILRTQQAVDMGDEFSAYIIDWIMPDLNGFEIVRRIRKIVGDSTPIIILTAYDISAVMDEGKDAGVTAFCNKPIFLSELRDTLVSVLEKRQETSEKPKAENEKLKGKRLLLVEDNELNREIAEELLCENGFIVETAEDGSVAVEIVKKSTPGWFDLILMDVQMPIMNGYDATRAIRALDDERLSKIPIVAMTANAFDEDRRKAAECGMNAHVAKPIDVEKLLEVLHKLLSED